MKRKITFAAIVWYLVLLMLILREGKLLQAADGHAATYTDADGDGWPIPSDCDDTNANIYPTAFEACDGTDNNCDGNIDEGYYPGYQTWYADWDADGYGDASNSISSCYPFWPYTATDNTDCDPWNWYANPGASEICDYVDNNCDGQVDEGYIKTWYADYDGDGYGDGNMVFNGCNPAWPYTTTDNTDCSPWDAAINPGASEACDGMDNNCNQLSDEGLVYVNWYADWDNDGYGDPNNYVFGCGASGIYNTTDSSDCMPWNWFISPGAPEVCDGLDNNCDGEIDEGQITQWYADWDNDGYGDPNNSITTCWPSWPYSSSNNLDCDPGNGAIHPQAVEYCNGVDDNCNALVDDDDPSVVGATWYWDADGDGFGQADSSIISCSPPAGYAAVYPDCDDGDAAINPAAAETCNGVDDNCNVLIDADDPYVSDALWYYADNDGDGFGNAFDKVLSCVALSGYVLNYQDCDDTNSGINPLAAEQINGIDDNCNGLIDEIATEAAAVATPQLKVFPNPVTQLALWIVAEGLKDTPIDVRIRDSMGKEVLRQSVPLSGPVFTVAVPKNELADGMYVVELRSGQTVMMACLVVAR
ncbi:MAG: MopE-related protein [Chitinophagales bacterium]|nr:MopE-related protein [Chitinophagales bacterium]MDW8427209.1 MopE-related protein [Chitinophagales bacterium]